MIKLFMEIVIIACILFLVYKLYGFYLFRSISNAIPDRQLKSFLKVLGEDYLYKDELLGTKYKWYKNGFVITAIFDDEGKLVEKSIHSYNFFTLRNRISFSNDV